MRQFFKFTLASALGFILAGVVLNLLAIVILVGLAGSLEGKFGDKKEIKVKENSILHLRMSGQIVDRTGNDPFNDLDLGPFKGAGATGLDDILVSLRNAATDDKIEGVFLEVEGVAAGLATLEEIREALLEFKESGKWSVAYAENMGQGSYYVATACDEVYMYPEGSMDFSGLGTQLMFFKGMLEKLDVEAQIIRGKNNKFKSAVEPFMYDEMSDANRAQLTQLLGSIWSTMMGDVSDMRDISEEELNQMADSLVVQSAAEAAEWGMIDGTRFKDQIMADLMERVEAEEEDDLNFISISKYAKHKPQKEGEEKAYKIRDRIAVIYAAGEIRSGDSDSETLGSETIAKAIKEARQDSNVKAIVFRVNSPGGSALASDVIWRETMLAKKEKPFIVSMGDLAASGGYYISAHADRIFAQSNTVTGSIGVFGILPNAEGFFNNKLGITFDGVSTNEHSGWGGIDRPLDDYEYATVQRSVEMVYDTFLTRVATGRGMTKEAVDAIGQGRVWSGADALEIGLVDELGGLYDAIAYAQEQAGLEQYRLKSFPKEKDPFEEFFKGLAGETEEAYLRFRFGQTYEYLQQLEKVAEMKGIQARLPYVLKIQ